MRLGDLDDLKVHISELMLVYKGTELDNAILNAIDNAPPVEPKKEIVPVCKVTFDKEQLQEIVDKKVAELVEDLERPQVNCKDCDGYEAGYSAGLKDAEKPQGEWIKVTKAGTVPVEYICSLCRRKIYDNYELTTPIDEFYPFCHCGADMRKGKKHERPQGEWMPRPEPYTEKKITNFYTKRFNEIN